MANSIATITRYLSKMIDQVFVESSKTEILENGSKFIDLDFKEAGYVKIYNILMDGLSDYYRANSVYADPEGPLAGQYDGTSARDTSTYSRYAPEYGTAQRDGFSRGSVKGGWELFKLRYYRAKQFVVDQMDDEETAGAIIANLLTEFIRTKVVPEVDAVRFDTLIKATDGGIGNLVTESINYDDLIGDNGLATKSMLAKFNKAFVWLNKHEVPDEDQAIFVSEDVWGLLFGDPMLTRFIDVENRKSESGLSFEVKTYMGRPIIHVPESRFFTSPVLGDNGYHAGTDSKKINFIVCSLKSIVPVVKLDYTKIWSPETQDDFIGYKVNFALYHDAFIPHNKKVSVYASVGTSGTDANGIDLAVVDSTTKAAATASTTKVIVNDYLTQPAGLLGTLIYNVGTSNPFAVGKADGVEANKSNVVELGKTEITLNSTNHNAFFALVQHGVTIATGSYTRPAN